MAETLLLVVAVLVLVALALLVALLVRVRRDDGHEMQLALREALAASEKAQADTLRLEAKGIRDETQLSLSTTRQELGEEFDRLRTSSTEQQQLFQRTVQERLDRYEQSLLGNADRMAQVLRENRLELVETLRTRLENLQKSSGEAAEKQTLTMTQLRDKVSESVVTGLREIQDKNEQKLEQMRLTVDEKLQKTLDTRLTQSFELVTRQLLEVQKGLTEMQTLAQDVGGLKKALTNVKVRGMLGEAQLSGLLEQFLSPDQYGANVAIKPRSAERVEFAISLPGVGEGERVWLPIDSKFPIEDYSRLQEAYENGDKAAWEVAGKAFETRLSAHAADISAKYIDVPHSTDFALMFLPFESLYAEAIRRPGLFQEIQRRFKVNIVGPTTLAAFLNSLQVGFKTLAISKQSAEVWKVLGAIKTEFQKFGEAVSRVQDNLEKASSNLGKVSFRAKQMERKLGTVSALPQDEAQLLLPAGDETGDDALSGENGESAIAGETRG